MITVSLAVMMAGQVMSCIKTEQRAKPGEVRRVLCARRGATRWHDSRSGHRRAHRSPMRELRRVGCFVLQHGPIHIPASQAAGTACSSSTRPPAVS